MCVLLLLVGCNEVNYFEGTTEETTQETTSGTTEEITTEYNNIIFPDSVYDYNVEDTILVPH